MKKTLNVFFKIVFSRTMITILLLLIQIGILFSGFRFFREYLTVIYGGFTILSGAVLVYIVNSDDMPEMKMVWILPVCVFPVFGSLLYLTVISNLGGLGLKKAVEHGTLITKPYMQTAKEVQEHMAGDSSIQQMSDYIYTISGCPTYENTKVTYFPLGEEKYKDLLIELKKAQKFIFLEYFIIERGIMWNSILEILQEKVREGVEVRVMYDGMCSLLLLPYSYPKQLQAMGIQAKMVSPIKPMLSTHQNNRDHRKILVIDGKVAYNGGVNLADEYINAKEVYGHWKDIAVKLEGDAVQGFTSLFLQMWNGADTPDTLKKYLNIVEENISKASGEGRTAEKNITEKNITEKNITEKNIIEKSITEKRVTEEYIAEGNQVKENPESASMGYVIPYGDVPTDNEQLGESVYMDILNRAEKYVHIMTPYLILDYNMATALTYAAKRGVDVKIILPHIPDKKIPFAIARSFYPELLQQGVRIYEYTPGFVHAKCFVSDDRKAVVGTINLDYRSLYHHFECATYIYDNPVIKDIEADYEETLTRCQEMTMVDYKRIGGIQRVMGHVYRLFAPLM